MAQMTRHSHRDVHAQPPDEGTDEFVRILIELTGDFERFDSMIHDQRSILEDPGVQSRRGDDIDRESLRFKLEAAEMAIRTRKALEQLGRLAELPKTSLRSDRQRGLARQQRTG